MLNFHLKTSDSVSFETSSASLLIFLPLEFSRHDCTNCFMTYVSELFCTSFYLFTAFQNDF
jgi:hypothetical protein